MRADLVNSLYPLGLFANLFFGSAFLLQWAFSAWSKKSYIPKAFWHLSAIGSFLMTIHGIIQSQYPVTLLHTINFIISLRNLNLYHKSPLSFKTTAKILLLSSLFVSLLFVIRILPEQQFSFMSAPNIFDLPIDPPSIGWKTLGISGLTIFSSRFLIQWIYAEYYKVKNFPEIFWKIGLIGGILSLVYFIRVVDPINIISYGCGMFPPIANLWIIRHTKKNLPKQDHLYFISAGEHSGDRLGADLIKKILKHDPQAQFFGVGGPLMKEQGLNTIFDMESLQISGFKEVFLELPKIIFLFFKLLGEIIKKNPSKVICIDFPDFHLLLIKKLRKKGFKNKIIHYVCPSIWAWRPKRKKILERDVNVLLTILPFEKDLFTNKKSNLKVLYVGHPLVQDIAQYQHQESWKSSFQIPEGPSVAFFPGSRSGDILRNLSVQLQAFKASSLYPSHLALISCSSPTLASKMLELAKKEGIEKCYIIPAQHKHALARSCSYALAKCGTIVFELALNLTPTVVTCRLGPLDGFLIKYVFRVFLLSYSLPNMILRQNIFPEFVGDYEDTNPLEIAKALEKVSSPEEQQEQRSLCQKLRLLMTENIPSDEEIFSIISS